MPIYNLYSMRLKQERGEIPDVFQYDEIPDELRVQIFNIICRLCTSSRQIEGQSTSQNEIENYIKWLYQNLAHEHGRPNLIPMNHRVMKSSYIYRMEQFIYHSKLSSTEQILDCIELAFGPLVEFSKSSRSLSMIYTPPLKEAIEELNHRFKERGVGYQYESGQIIKVDSTFTHSEIVRPSLLMLTDPMYEGANEEFLKALEHYKKGNYKETLNECLKSFESCMKAICAKRVWTYTEKDTASKLIQILLDEELIPTYMQTHFNSLRSTLEAGLWLAPIVRPRNGKSKVHSGECGRL